MEEYERFCASHKYEGGIDRLAVNCRLGHVMSRKKFEGIMVRSLSSLKAGDKTTKRTLDGFLRLNLDVQKQQMESWKERRFPGAQMWSSYDTPAGDPFRKIGNKEETVRNRLGLGHIRRGTPLLTLVHRLPRHIKPFTPTAFDAEGHRYFRPGGRTEPLYGPKGLGMSEVVHEPIPWSSLEEAICPAIR
jgi:hypothetical protein